MSVLFSYPISLQYPLCLFSNILLNDIRQQAEHIWTKNFFKLVFLYLIDGLLIDSADVYAPLL